MLTVLKYIVDSISPDRYKIPTPFNPEDSVQQKNKQFASRKITFCFGAPREAIKAVQNVDNLCADKKNPGPGTYTDHTLEVGVNARKSTVHSRNFYLDSGSMAVKNGVPGPGTYED